MDEEPGLSDQYRRASPWPLFVALGLALSEVGIVVGLFAVAVGGLLLFAGSVAGILKESGYVDRLWGSLLGSGGALAVVGGALVVWQVGVSPDVVLGAIGQPGQYGQVVPRALAIAVAGLILLAAGGTGHVLEESAAEQ